MATLSPCRMLRWSISGDDRDLNRVKFTLHNLIDNVAELRGGANGYAEFAKCLGLRT